MFDALSDRLESVFRSLRGKGRLSDADIDATAREIRIALLEADVALPVVKAFIGRLKERARGVEVSQALNPAQQIIKIVRDELVGILGGDTATLRLAKQPPTVILLAGLQGSGKTTLAGKLGRWLRTQRHSPLLVAADLQRPNAVQQLTIVAGQAGVDVFAPEPGSGVGDPVAVARASLDHARRLGHDIVVVDTAGRLGIDAEMMAQAARIRDAVQPDETLFVVDAMIGQDAVTTALAFLDGVGFSGVVLTKLDGDARGGAALSVKAITGKPVKFVGMGESLDRLEEFRPDGMASRILGRGDVVGLIQQFEDVVDEEKAEQDAVRMLKGKFDMNDFLEQIAVLKKMGSLSDMVDKIPGMADAMPEGAKIDDRELDRIKAVISSMTEDERRHPERFVITSWEEIVDGGKRKKKRSAFYDQGRIRRVARGSGRKEQEVADLLNRFATMRQMMMQIGMSTGLLGKIPGFKQLAQLKKLGGLDVNQLASMMNTPSAERGHFQAPRRNVDKVKEKQKRKNSRKARKAGRKHR